MRASSSSSYVFIISILVCILICFIIYTNIACTRAVTAHDTATTTIITTIPEDPAFYSPIPYRQVGILIPEQCSETVLPLMGRPLIRRDKWQYYAISNQHNNVRLPVRVNGKEATNEYGIDRLYKGDCNIMVEGQRERFKANIYDEINNNYVPTV